MDGTVIDELIVRLNLDGSGYKQGQEDTAKSTKKLRDDAEQTAKSLTDSGKQGGEFFGGLTKAAIGLFAILGSARGFEKMIRDSSTLGTNLGNVAQAANVSARHLSALQNMLQKGGFDTGAAGSALGSLAQQQAAFSTTHNPESAPALGLLSRFGVADVATADPAKLLEELSQSKEWQGLSLQQQISWGGQMQLPPDLIQLMHNDGPAKFARDLETSGTVDQKNVDADKAINDALASVSQNIGGLKQTVLLLAAPTLVANLQAFANVLSDINSGLTTGDWSKLLTDLSPPTDQAQLEASQGVAPIPTTPQDPYTGQWGALTPYLPSWVPGSQGWMTDDQKTRANDMVNQLVSLGATKVAAAGMVGNAMNESGLNPSAVSPDGKYHGLYQWDASRWGQLTAKYGQNPTAAQQTQFIWDEMQSGRFQKAKAALMAAQTPQQAAAAFDFGVENPQAKSDPNLSKRQAYAANIGGGAPLSTDVQKVLQHLRNTNTAKKILDSHLRPSQSSNTKHPHVTFGDVHIQTAANTSTSIARDAVAQIRQRMMYPTTGTLA